MDAAAKVLECRNVLVAALDGAVKMPVTTVTMLEQLIEAKIDLHMEGLREALNRTNVTNDAILVELRLIMHEIEQLKGHG